MRTTDKIDFDGHEMMDSIIWHSIPDLDLLAELVTKAKGERSMARFAYECEMSTNTIIKTLHKKRKHGMCYRDLKAVAEHAEPGSRVTLEKLLEACGVKDTAGVIIQEERRIFNTPAPKRRIRKVRYTEKAPRAVSLSAADPDYIAYISDLAFYSRLLEKGQIRYLYEKKDVLYQDKAFVQMLKTYKQSHEDDCEAFADSISTGRLFSPKAEHVKKVLDSYLFKEQ